MVAGPATTDIPADIKSSHEQLRSEGGRRCAQSREFAQPTSRAGDSTVLQPRYFKGNSTYSVMFA
jgi:hypothetical protein